MATCIQLCSRNCVHCGTACGTNVANGAALVGTVAINGDLDTQLVANGSIFGYVIFSDMTVLENPMGGSYPLPLGNIHIFDRFLSTA